MKECPYCKSEIRDQATRCPYCTSELNEEREVGTVKDRVTYVLDRDLVRFAKFAASILGIFLIVGVYLYGAKLEELAKDLKKAQDEHLADVKTTKKEIAEQVSDARTNSLEMRKLHDEITSIRESIKGNLTEITVQLGNARTNSFAIRRLQDEITNILASIQGSQEKAIGGAAQISLLVKQLGNPQPASFGTVQAERLIETKLLTTLRGVLPEEQYAKLKQDLKSGVPGIRRAIYDAQGKLTLPGKLVRSEGSSPTGDVLVTEVYDNIETFSRFFSESFGRNIGQDTRNQLNATVHYGNKFNNAFWDGAQLVVGDGDGRIFKTGSFACLSLMAHELSHAVIASTANLDFVGESGALCEHLADVFGSLTEQWSKNQTVQEATWLMGSGVFGPSLKGTALRSLKDPGNKSLTWESDDQPGHVSRYINGGDIHSNSGIPNRAFYEVAVSIGGHAWEKAGRIWYQSMLKLNKTSSFQEFASTTYQESGNLYGKGSTEQLAVKKGWQAVGIPVGN